MKTITAKQFQLQQAKFMKEVANGAVYQVTFHGKPWVLLQPGSLAVSTAPPGSLVALKRSLKHTLPDISLPNQPDYKALRGRYLNRKYGSKK